MKKKMRNLEIMFIYITRNTNDRLLFKNKIYLQKKKNYAHFMEQHRLLLL